MISWMKMVLAAGTLSLFSSRAAAVPGNFTSNITYNEAVRQVMMPENYQQAFTAYEGFGPAIALLVVVPLLWNLVYAGFIEEWRCDNYWYLFLSTVFVTGIMLVVFPYLLMAL